MFVGLYLGFECFKEVLIACHNGGDQARMLRSRMKFLSAQRGLLSSRPYTEDVSSPLWVSNDDSCGVAITGADTRLPAAERGAVHARLRTSRSFGMTGCQKVTLFGL
jgi:hypothetical protein